MFCMLCLILRFLFLFLCLFLFHDAPLSVFVSCLHGRSARCPPRLKVKKPRVSVLVRVAEVVRPMPGIFPLSISFWSSSESQQYRYGTAWICDSPPPSGLIRAPPFASFPWTHIQNSKHPSTWVTTRRESKDFLVRNETLVWESPVR